MSKCGHSIRVQGQFSHVYDDIAPFVELPQLVVCGGVSSSAAPSEVREELLGIISFYHGNHAVGCVNFDKILFLFRLQFFIMSLGPLMINKKFQLDRYSPSYQEIEIQSVGKHPKRSNENVCIFSPNVWADAFNWSFRLTYYPQAF